MKTKPEPWEKEFDIAVLKWQKQYHVDVSDNFESVKDFIRSLLLTEKKALLERVREEVIGGNKGTSVWNERNKLREQQRAKLKDLEDK